MIYLYIALGIVFGIPVAALITTLFFCIIHHIMDEFVPNYLRTLGRLIRKPIDATKRAMTPKPDDQPSGMVRMVAIMLNDANVWTQRGKGDRITLHHQSGIALGADGSLWLDDTRTMPLSPADQHQVCNLVTEFQHRLASDRNDMMRVEFVDKVVTHSNKRIQELGSVL